MDDYLARNFPSTWLVVRPPSREQSVTPLLAMQGNLPRIVPLRSAFNLKVGARGVTRRTTNSMLVGREEDTQE